MKSLVQSLSIGIILFLLPSQTLAQITCESKDFRVFNSSSTVQNINKPCGDKDKCVGKIVWENGSFYEGEVKNGKMNGDGKLNFPKNFQYEGSFLNGNIHGNGKIIYDNGSQYDGEWEFGKKNGSGSFIYPCGVEYFGNFKNDKFHGEGVARISDKESYSGFWNEGTLEGNAIHYLPDGSHFEGLYENGIRNGSGMIIWENGDTMQSIWMDGMIFQESKFKFTDGSIIFHFWENGKMQDRAVFVHPNGMAITATPSKLADLILKTSISNLESVENNFTLASYSAAMEYKNQQNYEGVAEQLELAQFFQDPFEESNIANLINSEIEYLSKEKKKIEVANKSIKKSKNH